MCMMITRAPVVQAYGLTETCAGGAFSDFSDTSVGRVGPPLPCCFLKVCIIYNYIFGRLLSISKVDAALFSLGKKPYIILLVLLLLRLLFFLYLLLLSTKNTQWAK